MDYVVEHFRQKHLEEEERKAKKLAAQKLDLGFVYFMVLISCDIFV